MQRMYRRMTEKSRCCNGPVRNASNFNELKQHCKDEWEKNSWTTMWETLVIAGKDDSKRYRIMLNKWLLGLICHVVALFIWVYLRNFKIAFFSRFVCFVVWLWHMDVIYFCRKHVLNSFFSLKSCFEAFSLCIVYIGVETNTSYTEM